MSTYMVRFKNDVNSRVLYSIDKDIIICFKINIFLDNQLAKTKQPWEQASDHHVPEIFKILKLEQDNQRFCTNLSDEKKSNSDAPTVTFIHLESQVKCKLQTANFPTVQKSMLIKFLCALDTRVRPLLILVRYWSSFNRIFDSPDEGMRNCLPVYLMIFHLANRKIIPSLSHLQSLDHSKMIWKNADISFCGDINKVPPNNMKMLQDKSICTLSVLSLLKDFFERFGVASLNDNAVCLWPAKFITKRQLIPGNEDNLSEDFVKKLRIGADGKIIMQSIDQRTPMCVQDLFDMTLNLTSKVKAEDVKRFQMECWKTSEKLEEIINSGKPHLMDMFIGSTIDLISSPREIHMEIVKENLQIQKAVKVEKKSVNEV